MRFDFYGYLAYDGSKNERTWSPGVGVSWRFVGARYIHRDMDSLEDLQVGIRLALASF